MAGWQGADKGSIERPGTAEGECECKQEEREPRGRVDKRRRTGVCHPAGNPVSVERSLSYRSQLPAVHPISPPRLAICLLRGVLSTHARTHARSHVAVKNFSSYRAVLLCQKATSGPGAVQRLCKNFLQAGWCLANPIAGRMFCIETESLCTPQTQPALLIR
jgi:hypothetical protein